MNEKKLFFKKYKEFLKTTDFSRKNEGRIPYKVNKQLFTVVAKRYDWAIANLVPPEKRDEAVSNTPKTVVFMTRAINRFEAEFKVWRHYGNKLKGMARVHGCMLIREALKEYPIYHTGGSIKECVPADFHPEDDDDNVIVINLLRPQAKRGEKVYKWRGVIPEGNKRLPKSIRCKVERRLPEFYKDKCITLSRRNKDTQQMETVRIRYSVYNDHDSPYQSNMEWKRGYPRKVIQNEVKTVSNVQQNNNQLKPL